MLILLYRTSGLFFKAAAIAVIVEPCCKRNKLANHLPLFTQLKRTDMKLKVVLFAAVSIFTVTSIYAQSSAQLRAGINLANISVTDNGRVNEAHQLTSFQVGIIGDLPLSSFFSFQPGLIYTGKGAKAQSGDENSSNYYKATFNPYYLEIPANFVVKLPLGTSSKLFVGAGPYLAMGVSGKNKVEGKVLGVAFNRESSIEFSNDDPSTLNYEEGAGFGIMKRFDYGLNGTAGIEGKSIVLGINYGLGLAKLQSGSNSSEDNNNKNRVFSVTVGFRL